MPEENFFRVGELPQQKPDGSGTYFPAVVFPNASSDTSTITISMLVEAIKGNKTWLDSLLHQSSAILFRGFPLSTSSDFNDFVEAFGYDELPYVGGLGPRNRVVGRVFTANESPPDQYIPFHHEMSYAREFPTKLFFFCEEEPMSGGETPIVLSHRIYERMEEKHPEFVKKMEEQGLIYTRVLGMEDGPSVPDGRGWKTAFMTSDKSVAEDRAASQGMTLEWMEGVVHVRTGPVPGIRYDEVRQRKVWFNSIVAAYKGSEDGDDGDDSDKGVMFGNGKLLPPHVIYDCLKVMEEECVVIPWRKGDVLFIDNLAVLHSRRPLITPPRRILASLCK